jgi:hypothetical protein
MLIGRGGLGGRCCACNLYDMQERHKHPKKSTEAFRNFMSESCYRVSGSESKKGWWSL